VVLVHAVAPPVPGGTNVVLVRLFGALPALRLEVFTDLARRMRVRRGGELSLRARYRYFVRLGAFAQRVPALRPLTDALDLPLAIVAGLRIAAGLRRSAPPPILFAPLDSGFSVIAMAVTARITGRPYVVMVFDLWEENAYGALARAVARRFEKRILGGAAALVAFSDRMSDHYRGKHGLTCEVIDTPIAAGPTTERAEVKGRGPVDILVGGAVYWAQEDAVRRLLRVAARMPDVTTTMVGDEAELRGRGFHADAYEPRLSGAEYRRRLRAADIAFVGLSLESAHPEVLLTATPARLPEAMASGRPLLLHVPAGSHAARYAREEDFAEVVDAPDDDALETGLRALIDDPERARERAARAVRLAAERHDVAVVAAAFREILKRVAGPTRSGPSTPPERPPAPLPGRTR
jgi:glycosyltransferase involved in cell wall biosynthesis